MGNVSPFDALKSLKGELEDRGDVDAFVISGLLARYVVSLWESPSVRSVAVPMLRQAIGEASVGAMVIGYMEQEMLSQLREIAAMSGVSKHDAPLRIAGVTSVIIGMVMARYVVELPLVAQLSTKDVTSVLHRQLHAALRG